ncbi:helix-turn-helix domain-containing protein [Dickeya solani]|uniref:Helix-turn-helix domain-containing protein n=1 Tax=Dickeya solani TaxID=1089444 RepID=A0ABU4EAH5_9GAMM|nr:helix-turn-helix domain-containing protein [Dickeya solani]MCA6997643.1 helix-turn-helix domain-containing protein [Dickeya solani]MCZ0821253.1 helix-turn-helix domain-containing protein [Dickeya solani]MDV6997514.1 helix-turn-helix domain-containing protein [Dickeya solani]MDV7003619.1 helix-turn-helix domain-containing protein [Dickeya solani]MDV7036152.1 helix-turn-helix domain-containing protein [Dickeya solani]
MKFHDDIVMDLKKWIASNLSEKIVIDVISERSGYSKWYVQRLFRKITGITLATYVRQQRLSKASRELINKNHTIAYIALQNGFADQQTFHRVFARYYKQAPSKWRKNQSAGRG